MVASSSARSMSGSRSPIGWSRGGSAVIRRRPSTTEVRRSKASRLSLVRAFEMVLASLGRLLAAGPVQPVGIQSLPDLDVDLGVPHVDVAPRGEAAHPLPVGA